MRITFRHLAFSSALLLAFLNLPFKPAHAADAPSSTQSASVPYITPDQFDFKAILTPPPADDSPEHKAEVDRMLSLQEARTPEDIKRCKSEEKVTAFAFETELGPWFNAKDLPLTAALMKEAYKEANSVSKVAKHVWVRVRPPLADKRIHPCVELEDTPSYPSGHATRGIMWAMLLAEIFPEHRDALLVRGKQIGDDRFMAGMHYPSDVAGGQKLGTEIAKKLLANDAFQAKLAQAKAECLADAAVHH